ncbi:SIMPL domain-containing protein [Candidatus Micrarchaeota archaeon]|nr:SIMPL domain-containing protein [Candidatus Micrarchaeota archaeon]
MAKEDEGMCFSGDCGKYAVVAALLIAIGMMGGGYLLAQGDYSPDVNVSSGPTYPNVYVSSTPPDHVISVSGTASKKVAPDLLNIQIRVQTESANARTSQEDNAAVSADLRSKLKALGLNESSIQTVAYSVNPVYDSVYSCEKPLNDCHYDSVLIGYRTTQSLNVELTMLDKGGDVIDAASTAGTNQTFIDSVQFTLKDETRRAVQKALLKEASGEAKSKAESIAQGVGVSLGKVLSASESASYYPAYYRTMAYDMAAGAPAPKTELSAGQVDVTTTVSASFEVSG